MAAKPITTAALELAARGIPVFPLKANKRPCQVGAWKDASTDQAAVARLFADPLASLIGVPTGAVSGFDILDIDPRKGGDLWERENAQRLPATRTHATRSGGTHYLMRHTPGCGGTSADRIAPGVDIRSDGGYAVWWPAHGFATAGTLHAPWPDWLLLANLRNINPNTPVPNAEDLSPPDAASLLALLAVMPNPESVTRDDYTAVNLAVQGCIRSLEALNRDVDPSAVYDAAAEWSARWDSADASDYEAERVRWDEDWSTRDRDISGWRHLLGMAQRFGADVSAFTLAAATAEFGALPPEPESAVVSTPPAALRPAITSYRFRRGHNPYGDRRWLVHQTLPEIGVAFLAGQYAAGKTFVALDLAYSVMAGERFAGVDVDRKGGVLFLAAEGESEIPVRLEAILQTRGSASTTDLPFIWLDDVPVLLASDGKDKLIAAVRDAAAQFRAEGIHLALVVVDTVAAAAGWTDENNAAEAQAAIRVMQALAKETGALVLAVDHHGKDQNAGVRGSTAKSAGAEAVLSVLGEKQVNGTTTDRRLALHKVRGGASGRELPFDLQTVDVGVDAKGRPVTTCVVDWRAHERPPAVEKLPRTASAALSVLREMIADNAGAAVAETAWREACDDRRISTADDKDGRGKAFRRAYALLLDRKAVESKGGQVSLGAVRCTDFASLTGPDISDISDNVRVCPPGGRTDDPDISDICLEGMSNVRSVRPHRDMSGELGAMLS
jgi:hypothetical protein